MSSQSSHHPQEVLLAQFSLYVHKGGRKPDSFHFYLSTYYVYYTCIGIYYKWIRDPCDGIIWSDSAERVHQGPCHHIVPVVVIVRVRSEDVGADWLIFIHHHRGSTKWFRIRHNRLRCCKPGEGK